MPRPPREWEVGGLYHLVPKGNDDRDLFRDDRDRLALLERCGVVAAKYDLSILSFCLMRNHAHFLVRCGEDGLSQAMSELLGRYSWWWNRRHERSGHLLRNRCFVVHIEDDAHLLNVARYIALNPAAAGVVERPEDWLWSSHRAHAGLDFPPDWLANSDFLRFFGTSPGAARAAYRRLVEGRSDAAAA
jgi:REP element-mobilizing transposase RayT